MLKALQGQTNKCKDIKTCLNNSQEAVKIIFLQLCLLNICQKRLIYHNIFNFVKNRWPKSLPNESLLMLLPANNTITELAVCLAMTHYTNCLGGKPATADVAL